MNSSKQKNSRVIAKTTINSESKACFWKCLNCNLSNLPDSKRCQACFNHRVESLNNLKIKWTNILQSHPSMTKHLSSDIINIISQYSFPIICGIYWDCPSDLICLFPNGECGFISEDIFYTTWADGYDAAQDARDSDEFNDLRTRGTWNYDLNTNMIEFNAQDNHTCKLVRFEGKLTLGYYTEEEDEEEEDSDFEDMYNYLCLQEQGQIKTSKSKWKKVKKDRNNKTHERGDYEWFFNGTEKYVQMNDDDHNNSDDYLHEDAQYFFMVNQSSDKLKHFDMNKYFIELLKKDLDMSD